MLGHVLGRGKGRCSSIDRASIEPWLEPSCLDIVQKRIEAQNQTKLARLTMLPAKGVLMKGFILGSVILRRTLLRKVGVLLGLCQVESIKAHDKTYAHLTFMFSGSKVTTFGGVQTCSIKLYEKIILCLYIHQLK
ncbi:hypothetical protein CsSME_00034563 [Camellia sinensis var. sinensis]